MGPTIYASFSDVASAKTAIAGMIHVGTPAANLSLLYKNSEKAIDLSGHPIAEPTQKADLDQDVGAFAAVFPDLRAGRPSGDPTVSDLGTRFSGIAAAANASASGGSMTDFLWDTLPSDMASLYRKEYDEGRPIVVVRDPAEGAEQLMRESGAMTVHREGYLA